MFRNITPVIQIRCAIPPTSYLCHPIFIKGDCVAIKSFIDGGEDVNIPDTFNRTYLHWASQGGDNEVVSQLLAAGALSNVRTNMGLLPLHNAVRCGHVGITRLLVEAGSKLDRSDLPFDQMTLHWAARLGSVELVKILCERAGADPSQLDRSGTSCGDVARKFGHRKLANVLDRMNGKEVHSDIEEDIKIGTQKGHNVASTNEGYTTPSPNSLLGPIQVATKHTANLNGDAVDKKEKIPRQRKTKRKNDDSDLDDKMKPKKRSRKLKTTTSPDPIPNHARGDKQSKSANPKRKPRQRPSAGSHHNPAGRKMSSNASLEANGPESTKKTPQMYDYDLLFGGGDNADKTTFSLKIPKRKN
eukprot:CFRG4856T1